MTALSAMPPIPNIRMRVNDRFHDWLLLHVGTTEVTLWRRTSTKPGSRPPPSIGGGAGQYPDASAVQGMLDGLKPFIEDARAGSQEESFWLAAGDEVTMRNHDGG